MESLWDPPLLIVYILILISIRADHSNFQSTVHSIHHSSSGSSQTTNCGLKIQTIPNFTHFSSTESLDNGNPLLFGKNDFHLPSSALHHFSDTQLVSILAINLPTTLLLSGLLWHQETFSICGTIYNDKFELINGRRLRFEILQFEWPGTWAIFETIEPRNNSNIQPNNGNH